MLASSSSSFKSTFSFRALCISPANVCMPIHITPSDSDCRYSAISNIFASYASCAKSCSSSSFSNLSSFVVSYDSREFFAASSSALASACVNNADAKLWEKSTPSPLNSSSASFTFEIALATACSWVFIWSAVYGSFASTKASSALSRSAAAFATF